MFFICRKFTLNKMVKITKKEAMFSDLENCKENNFILRFKILMSYMYFSIKKYMI